MKDRLDLPGYLSERKMFGVGTEVGVLFGEFSEHLLIQWPGTLNMVDPWLQQDPKDYLDGSNAVDMEAAFRETKERVARFGARANIIRAFSAPAAMASPPNSQDFVYIDANHAYPWVKRDLEVWWPKVRHGGLLCGHDFKNENTRYWSCGVQQVVEEFVAANDLTLILTPACTSWWIVKP